MFKPRKKPSKIEAVVDFVTSVSKPPKKSHKTRNAIGIAAGSAMALVVAGALSKKPDQP